MVGRPAVRRRDDPAGDRAVALSADPAAGRSCSATWAATGSQLDLADSRRALQQYFDFHWAPIGNLGVDLLVVPLAKLFGLEPAVKLIVMAIPPMTVAGLLWVAREVHHRLPPTVAVRAAVRVRPSVPVRLRQFRAVDGARLPRLRPVAAARPARPVEAARAAVRADPFVVFFAHAFGWGALGLLGFSAEAVRQHDKRPRLVRWRAFAPPFMRWRWRCRCCSCCCGAARPTGGMTGDWFNWTISGNGSASALRDRWENFDLASAAVVLAVPLFALVHPRLTLSRNLVFSGLVLALPSSCCRGSCSARPMPTCGWRPTVGDRCWRSASRHETRFPTARPGWRRAVWLRAGPACRDDRQPGDRRRRPGRAAEGARSCADRARGSRCWSSDALRAMGAAAQSDHLGAMVIVRREAFPTTNGRWPGRTC